MNAAFAKLERFRATVPAACKDAETFLALLPEDTKPPLVSLANDGEVNFAWYDPHIDLGFYGDATYSVYARDGKEELLLDDLSPTTLPNSLAALIARA